DVDAILPVFFGGLPDDMSKDEEVQGWLQAARSTLDQEKRKELYKKALQKIAAQAYWVPTWTYTTNYAISNDLDFKPTADEIPRFWTASWK
ncbi:MAG: ABC transporter substrate-binding protein, partial [Oceanibaculum sp.]|nr:ABC transporter substrate-binding protein [Oceanibaculum sp.]